MGANIMKTVFFFSQKPMFVLNTAIITTRKFWLVCSHILYNSIGQERDRFIIPRLLTNRIVALFEDEPPQNIC